MEVLLPIPPAVPHTSPYSGRRWPRHGGFEPALRTRRRRQRAGAERTTCTLRQRRPRQTREEVEGRIREQLIRARAAPIEHEQPAAASSSYDTAWVAMVPARGAPGSPRFPRYVEWIMQNQHDDGSWGLGGHLRLPWLRKDAISSTLACLLALKTWSVGDEHVRKGLRFIGDNWSCPIDDDKCETPIGFNIIVPGMVRSAIALGLELPMRKSDVNNIIHLREMELRSMDSGRKAYMAYVAEGLGDIIQDWDEVLTYQSKNGSLFNSPSATSALAIHSGDNNALKYLDELGNKFCSSVPSVDHMSIYSQLCMVDTLENMGISCHFSSEINSILDMAYRSWQQNDEEILMNMETCSIAFRILRMHGYHISSDIFSHFAEESRFHDSVEGHLNDTKALLELYKASQIQMYEDERILENVGSWTGKLLKQQLSSNRVLRRIIPKEVEYALQIPFYSAAVEPLEHKRNIEHFSIRCIQMRKSAYLACQAADDILSLAIEEFHSNQSLYQQEVKWVQSWFEEAGLDQLKFARKSPLFIWVFMASTVFPPELSDARIASIQNTLLTTAVDDFFDGGGTSEEQNNLIALIEKWEQHDEIGFCSQNVEILFRAVYSTMSEIDAKAVKVQSRSVMGHIAQIWIDYLKSNVIEAEWTAKGYTPTMEEYQPVAEVSSAIGPILAVPLFLAGTELSDDMINHPEYKEMLKHTSLCTRFLNDLGTYQKESSQGYVNAVLLLVHAHRSGGGGGGSASPESSMEAAKWEVRRSAVVSRRELLRLVVEGSAVPRPCRELFWKMCKVAHLFYLQGDGFLSLQELMAAAGAAVHEPLQVKLPSH